MSTVPFNIESKLSQASIYSDLTSLNAIREQSLTDEQGALKKAAKEFEAFFMNMMLKSMRQATAAIGENTLTGSNEEKMFTGLLDEQLAANLSQKGHLGIAELLLSQLAQNSSSKQSFELSESGIENNKKLSAYQSTPVTSLKPQLVQLVERKKDELVQQIKNDENYTQREQKIDSVKNEILQTESAEQTIQPEKKSLFNEMSDFISELFPYAKTAAEKLQLNPFLLLAQAALETGWGKFVMHDGSGNPGYNLFGIKAGRNWHGESIQIDTLEVENQAVKKVNASFRQYQSFAESFDDYVSFLSNNSRYQKALDLASDAGKFVEQLQKSGYATDPDYAKKIMKIFQQIKTHRFDLGSK